MVAGALCVACSQPLSSSSDGSIELLSGAPRAVRIVLFGDVMLGRRVGDVVANSPDTVFDRLRPVVVAADLALANLESPLTDRPHVAGPNALEADPVAGASLLAGAGFDAMAIANNHAGDVGSATIGDTVRALEAAGIEAIGGGADVTEALAPLVRTVHGVRIALLAFDLTLGGPPAGDRPGVASWDTATAERAVRSARAGADVVIVGVHGGVEFLPRPDPVLRSVVDRLTSWGADVVWGHGTHVAYEVAVVDGPDGPDGPDGRVSVQAHGLGNALFDQGGARTAQGAVLEVLVDTTGVVAHRTGVVDSYLRSSFAGWDQPSGDTALVGGEWWTLDRSVALTGNAEVVRGAVPMLVARGVLVDAVLTDLTGDGVDEMVAAYRTPFRDKVLHAAFGGVDFRDASGRAAHLGVFDATSGRLLWGAGTLTRPIARIAGCDRAIAVAFTELDDDTITGGGAWTWRGFGFATAAELDGAAIPTCADVDGDGSTEPVLLRHGAAPG